MPLLHAPLPVGQLLRVRMLPRTAATAAAAAAAARSVAAGAITRHSPARGGGCGGGRMVAPALAHAVQSPRAPRARALGGAQPPALVRDDEANNLSELTDGQDHQQKHPAAALPINNSHASNNNIHHSTFFNFVTRNGPAAQTPRQVFDTVLKRLEADFGDDQDRVMPFPREIILVNGAPGAGKSRNSRFILEARGLSTPPIVMSDLLARSPSRCEAMSAGRLIADVDVVEVLFRELLLPQYAQGVLVDGFPRTALQADCMHMLRDKMKELRAGKIEELKHMGTCATPQNVPYPVPRFFVCILHVSEDTSIKRQKQRGLDAREHNERVRASGIGDLIPVRETDLAESKVRDRYQTFVKHRNTLAKLKEYFSYTEIDASGDIKLVEQEILNQFQYQSRQDLSKRAFDTIQPILLASRIGMNARPYLVQRIEEYISFYPERFACAVDLVIRVFIPKLQSAAFAGCAVVRIPPESSDYVELSRIGEGSFQQMILDSLAERGYAACYDVEETLMPVKIDLATGAVSFSSRIIHLFRVEFPRAKLSHMRERSLNENRESQEPLFS